MIEIWSPIKGYEGYYEVSSYGVVRSVQRKSLDRWGKYCLRKGRILKPCNRRYSMVVLSKNGKARNCLVHRLVAEAFIPNPHNWSVVNHKDENKLNNRMDNLEWCSQKYNINYGKGVRKRAATQSISKKGKHYSARTEFKPGNVLPCNLRPVFCVETGKLYQSIKEACSDCCISRSTIYKSCKYGMTIKNLTFKFTPDVFAGEQTTGF